MYKQSVEDPDGFWGDIASTFFWRKKWPVKDGKLHSENIDVRNGRVAVEVRLAMELARLACKVLIDVTLLSTGIG